MEAKIAGTDEAWDKRELGADAAFVKAVSPAELEQIESSLGLQMISIRLERELIDSFKAIAEFHGIGYQPLMRDALKRFAYHELRSIVQGVVKSQRKDGVEGDEPVVKKQAKPTAKTTRKSEPKSSAREVKLKKAA